MKAKKVKLKAYGTLKDCFISCTEIAVTLNQDVEEYDCIVGSDDEDDNDGWATFRAGEKSWSAGFNGILDSNDVLFRKIINGKASELEAKSDITLDDDIQLSGDVIVTAAKLDASVKGFARVSANITGQDFPKLELL